MAPTTCPVNLKPSRIRLLVAMNAVDDESWQDWLSAREASPHVSEIALQRVFRDTDVQTRHAVGLGYGETLRWFGPIDDPSKRRLVIGYAGAVLDRGSFPPAGESGLTELVVLGPGAASGASAVHAGVPMEGVVLHSHAETDLLALERSRCELPAPFPKVVGHSLLGLSGSEALIALFGTLRSRRLLAIVRIHGTVSSVPGLAELIGLAHQEGWGLVVISGVGGSAELLPRTSNIEPELASNLTSYFMAGGVDKGGPHFRYAAAMHLGFDG